MNTSRKNRIIKITIWVVCSIVVIIALLAAAAFFWPAASKQLQSSSSEKLSYNDAIAAANRTVSEDTSNTDVRPECRSIIKTHDKKTAKAVMMIHGVSACPQQFADLGDTFLMPAITSIFPASPATV